MPHSTRTQLWGVSWASSLLFFFSFSFFKFFRFMGHNVVIITHLVFFAKGCSCRYFISLINIIIWFYMELFLLIVFPNQKLKSWLFTNPFHMRFQNCKMAKWKKKTKKGFFFLLKSDCWFIQIVNLLQICSSILIFFLITFWFVAVWVAVLDIYL